MSTENLKVVATAEISGLKTGMNDARKELASTAVAATKLDSSLKGGTKGTNQAANALTNLGRVAQDAPFGFIGIQNNLNPLLESFQRLKTETGSTKGALSALGSSLLGGGGLGLALSAVTAIVSFATAGFGAWTRGLSGNKAKLDETAKSSKDFADSLKGIIDNLAQEQVKVSVLVAQIKEENLTREQRNKAIQKLNEISPEYFGTLNKEKATIQEITIAYDNYSKSILNSIESKVREKQLVDVTTRILELQRKGNEKYTEIIQENGTVLKANNFLIDKNTSSIEDNRSEYQKLQAQVSKNVKLGTRTSGLFANEEEELRNLIGTRDKILKELVPIASKDELINIKDPKNKKEKKIKPFEKIRFKYSEDDLIFDFGPDTFENALAAQIRKDFNEKTFIKGYEETFVLPLKVQPKLEIINGLPTSLGQLDELNKIAFLKGAGVTKGFQDGFKIGIEGLRTGQLEELFNTVTEKITAFQTQLSTAIKGIATSSLYSLGEALGNALGGGDNVIKGLFDSIFSSVGDQISQLGKFLIQSGIKISIAKKAFEKLLSNPIASIAVGVGLVALGALIKNAVGQKPQGFATGVNNFGGGTALVGERGPELVQLPKGSNVVPNAQTLAMRGGNAIVAEYTIRGTDLVTILKRTNEFNSRNY